MAAKVNEQADGKLLEIHLTGKLVAEDYETFAAATVVSASP